MGRSFRFDIHLNNALGIYHPGDTLSGHVTVLASEDLPVYGIHLWIMGQADVSWSERPGARHSHYEYEIYMKDCFILWGKDPREKAGGDPLLLQAGAHEYDFQYPLPRSLPTSFESQDPQFKGRVHYFLHAKLESPDDSLRQHRDKAFLVLSHLDLNKDARLSEPTQLRKERKLYCCCCCKLGRVSCSLRLDRTGYVPGEDINLDAEIHNRSRREISTSYVTMQQETMRQEKTRETSQEMERRPGQILEGYDLSEDRVIRYHADGHSRLCASDIFRISGGKIKPGDSAFYHDIIHIPPLPPSRLRGCSLVDVDYVLTVGVQPSDASEIVELTIPVIIGTVPLKHVIPRGLTATPAFSRYSHSSGEIEDYTEDDYRQGRHQHVYVYYKSLYRRAEPTLECAEVT